MWQSPGEFGHKEPSTPVQSRLTQDTAIVCCLLSQRNLSMSLCTQPGGLDTALNPTGVSRGASLQVPAPCGLRACFRRCSVHPWLYDALEAKGSRKAAPVQLQSGKQKPPASSRSLHAEISIHFKGRLCLSVQSKGSIFCFLGIFLDFALKSNR